jgi:hypothetical protein
MKAKFVNESISFERGKDPKKVLGIGQGKVAFKNIVQRLEKIYDEDDDLLEVFEDYHIDEENLIISFNNSWSDDEYDCDVTMTVDFNKMKLFLNGDCENEYIEVPGPGYMTSFTYSNKEEEEISMDITLEELSEIMDDWCGNFSHFAQQEGEEQDNIDYCESCGSPEDECEKCENCGECANDCECDDEEDEEEEDED